MRPSTSSRVTCDKHVMADLASCRRITGIHVGGSTGCICPSHEWALLSDAGVRHVVDLCAAPGSWSQVGFVSVMIASTGMAPSDPLWWLWTA